MVYVNSEHGAVLFDQGPDLWPENWNNENGKSGQTYFSLLAEMKPEIYLLHELGIY